VKDLFEDVKKALRLKQIVWDKVVQDEARK
jgi:hypothetical protein